MDSSLMTSGSNGFCTNACLHEAGHVILIIRLLGIDAIDHVTFNLKPGDPFEAAVKLRHASTAVDWRALRLPGRKAGQLREWAYRKAICAFGGLIASGFHLEKSALELEDDIEKGSSLDMADARTLLLMGVAQAIDVMDVLVRFRADEAAALNKLEVAAMNHASHICSGFRSELTALAAVFQASSGEIYPADFPDAVKAIPMIGSEALAPAQLFADSAFLIGDRYREAIEDLAEKAMARQLFMW
jgi:hypothetical protein